MNLNGCPAVLFGISRYTMILANKDSFVFSFCLFVFLSSASEQRFGSTTKLSGREEDLVHESGSSMSGRDVAM